jgi:hypothetical protein
MRLTGSSGFPAPQSQSLEMAKILARVIWAKPELSSLSNICPGGQAMNTISHAVCERE